MTANSYADAIRKKLNIQTTATFPFTIVSFALMNSQGVDGAYINASGQLVTPNGISMAGTTLSGAQTVTGTNPNVTLAGSQTNTGKFIVSGKTSGSLVTTTADATLEALTLSAAAQTVGNATITIPNVASVNDTFALVTLAQTLASKTLTGAGSIISTAATGNGVGFGTGAGGAVTQASSITTGVTLSKPTGQITTVSSTLAAAASAVFTVTNTLVAATDTVIANVGTYAGGGTPVAMIKNVVAGAYDVVLQNVHASAALNAAVIINVSVIKGVAS